ncbi:MAG: hypothetical protein WCG83_01350 [Candidatus Peregrinibacteria bacterium]
MGTISNAVGEGDKTVDNIVAAVLSPVTKGINLITGKEPVSVTEAIGTAVKSTLFLPLTVIGHIIKGLALGTLNSITNVAQVTPFLPAPMADSWMNERENVQNSTKDQLATLKNTLPGFSIG